jgi:hypothetical protein
MVVDSRDTRIFTEGNQGNKEEVGRVSDFRIGACRCRKVRNANARKESTGNRRNTAKNSETRMQKL